MEGWYFSRQQKIGALLLICLLAAGTGGWWAWRQQGASQNLAFAVADSLYTPPTFAEAAERLDINLADSAAWAGLYGIGPVLSQRIVRYRRSQGGFDSVGQLSRVYGLRAETLAPLRPRLFVNPLTRQAFAETSAPKPQPRQAPPRIDINRASAADFARLPGIGAVLSQRIVNYRNAKGGFQAVADIRQVYRLEPETFARIEPYLYLDKPQAVARGEQAPPPARPVPAASIIDLNQANATQLATVPGIGAQLASRILKYRSRLGYYVAVEQLTAVYGLSPENYARMAPYLTVGDLSKYPKKPLNQATAQALALLPGMDQYQAEALIRTRERQGFFRDWAAVDQTPGLSAEAMRQLQAYYRL
jgi:competence ComEA-like helix-hairpin-helix protein